MTTEVEIQIPVVAAEGIADVGKTVQLFREVHAAADDYPSQRHVLQSADAAETGYPHVTVAERLNHARFDEQFGVTVAVLKRFLRLNAEFQFGFRNVVITGGFAQTVANGIKSIWT